MPQQSFKDLTGEHFGKITVLKYAAWNAQTGRTMWLVERSCDGKQWEVPAHDLLSGSTQGCGCQKKEAAAKRIPDLVGQEFGRLKVLKMLPERDKQRNVQWLLECKCDGTVWPLNQITSTTVRLLNGRVNSCGCLRVENILRNAWRGGRPTHGLSHDPLYKKWQDMLARCYNPNDEDYYNGDIRLDVPNAICSS